MRLLFVVTGAVVWAFWTLGALLLVALWVYGKRKARGSGKPDNGGGDAPAAPRRTAGESGTPTARTSAADATGPHSSAATPGQPAPAPFRATGTHSPTHYADVDALLQEVRK